MDIDENEDFDSKFLEQFSSMGTTDKDVLISEFKRLLGNQINSESCAFFLDMNNWNLQNAICSYYDYTEQPQSTDVNLPSSALIKDSTFYGHASAGEQLFLVDPATTPFEPNVKLTKTWQIKNTGEGAWPMGCTVRPVSGSHFQVINSGITVGVVAPQKTAELSVELISPDERGLHLSEWRLCTPANVNFGDPLYIRIYVGVIPAINGDFDSLRRPCHLEPLSLSQQVSPFLDLACQPVSMATSSVTSSSLMTSSQQQSGGDFYQQQFASTSFDKYSAGGGGVFGRSMTPPLSSSTGPALLMGTPPNQGAPHSRSFPGSPVLQQEFGGGMRNDLFAPISAINAELSERVEDSNGASQDMDFSSQT